MEQEQVIARIKETAEHILPKGASLWLYGLRACGDARPYKISADEPISSLQPAKEPIDTIA